MSRRSAFSLVEVMIFSAVLAVILLGVAQFLKVPFSVQRLVNGVNARQDATRALDQMAADVKEAVPESIDWSEAISTSALVFTQSRFDPASGQALPPTVVVYGYEPQEDHWGALVRVLDSTPTVILAPIEEPTLEAPLFQKDAGLHIIMVNVRYRPAGGAAVRVVRRVAVSG